MNEQEYKAWEAAADVALSDRYVYADRQFVLDWFRRIKGQEERELIGNEEVDAMLKFVCARGNFDMYNSLMARLFIYAPLILKEHREGC